ncbi:MAG: hypothetical protein ACKOW2_04255 [Sphingobacteriaceae bacterium]
MKLRFIFILGFLLFFQSVFSQTLNPNSWNDYAGNLGSYPIRLSLYLLTDGTVKGTYCYEKTGLRITLSGILKNDRLELTEWVNGKMNGHLKGVLYTVNADGFEGKWTNADRTKTYDFNLILAAITYGSLTHRYKDFKSGDLMVEQYARQIRSAILAENKAWLAEQINYPLKTSFGDKELHVIKSKADFMANYSRIFHPEFIIQIRSACTCNLFYDQDGAMLGNGAIWIDEYVHPPKGKKALFILGINN